MQQTGILFAGNGSLPSIPSYAKPLLRVHVTGSSFTSIEQEMHEDLAGFTIDNPNDTQLNLGGGRWFSTAATFHASTQTAIRINVPSAVLTRGQYEIRVKRVTPDTNNPSMSNKVFWATMRSIRNVSLLNFDKPLAMTAVRIRASNQLNGPLDNLNGLVTSILPDWNGSSWVTQPTQNPAAMFRTILQGPATAVQVPDSEIDLLALAEWADYCTAQGFRFNMVRDFRSSNWDALLDVCSAGRASIGQEDGKWFPIVDELLINDPPVQHFSPRNSWDFRAEKVYRQLPHAFRLRYLDEDNGYTQAETFAYQDGYSASNATIYEQLEIPGITNETTIIRHGRMHFGQAMLRPETYSFNSDLENLLCRRGDRIRVTHDVPLWGLQTGRVKAVNGQVITLDEFVVMTWGISYAIRFRLADGSSLIRSVIMDPLETDTITLSGSGNVPATGDLFLFGESGTESARLVVSRIEPSDQLTARLFCFDESPGIYQADVGPITPWLPQITQPREFRLIEGGEFEGEFPDGGRWVMDDPTEMQIIETLIQRHGKHALAIEPSASDEWVRPNANLPKKIPDCDRIYMEAWSKSDASAPYIYPGYVETGYVEEGASQPGLARAALGWYTSSFYLFHAQMGDPLPLTNDYQRARADAAVPAGAMYVHFQVGTVAQVEGNAWIDDVLGLAYTLPIVGTSTISVQNNYIRMQDQSGGIWHLSALDGWPCFDTQITIGTQQNVAATWAWIQRQSPDLTIWYLYPDTNGTVIVNTTQPGVGAGSASAFALIDKRTFQSWTVAVSNEGTYKLVEAA